MSTHVPVASHGDELSNLNPSNNKGLVASVDTVRYPDSSTCLSLSYVIDDGSEAGLSTTSILRGERAEHLPTVLRHIEGFLHEAGYEVELQSVPRRRAPGLRVWAAAALLLIAVADIGTPSIGVIGNVEARTKVEDRIHVSGGCLRGARLLAA